MKKIIYILYLFLFAFLHAEETKLDIKGSLVREFTKDELKIAQYDRDFRYPHAIYFDNEGKLSICDSMNSQIAKLNSKFEFVDSIKINNTFYSSFSYNFEDNNNIYQFSRYAMEIINKKTLELIDVAIPHMSSDFRYNYGIYINNTYINWTKDNQIYSIENPQGDDYKKNNLKLQGNEKTLDLLKSKKFSSRGYSVDDEKRIFYNGELLTRSFPVFWYYWNDESVVLEANGKIYNPHKMNSTRFLGRDNDGNYIWHKGSIVLIFNKNGQMISNYYSSDIRDGVFTQKDGDIYILKNKEYPIQLLIIKKQW